MARSALFGLGAGAAGGTAAGTIAFPVYGTIIGFGFGLAAAVWPTLVGSLALWWAARPGTAAEVFDRRRRRVMTVVAGLTGVVGVVVAVIRSGPGWGPFTTATVCGVLVAVALAAAGSAYLRIDPLPSGARDRGGLGVLVGLALAAAAILVPVWNEWTDLRGTWLVESEMKRVGTLLGTEAITTASSGGGCDGGGRYRRVLGRTSEGALDVPSLGRAYRADGWSVTRGVDVSQTLDTEWLLAARDDTQVVVTMRPRYDDLDIDISHGCPAGRRPRGVTLDGPSRAIDGREDSVSDRSWPKWPGLMAASVMAMNDSEAAFGPMPCDGAATVIVTLTGDIEAGAAEGARWRVDGDPDFQGEVVCVRNVSPGGRGRLVALVSDAMPTSSGLNVEVVGGAVALGMDVPERDMAVTHSDSALQIVAAVSASDRRCDGEAIEVWWNRPVDPPDPAVLRLHRGDGPDPLVFASGAWRSGPTSFVACGARRGVQAVSVGPADVRGVDGVTGGFSVARVRGNVL